MNKMNKFKGNLDAVFIVAIGIIGILAIIFSIYQNYTPLDKLSVLIGLINALFLVAGYERYRQREETEKKVQETGKNIEKFLKDFEEFKKELGGIEIIEGSVTETLIESIRTAKYIIRATAFFNSEYQDEHDIDKYYEELGKLIKEKKGYLTYRCCYAKGYDFQYRKEAFKKLELTDSELKRMSYYELTDKLPINLIIIDTNTAIIGFRRHSGNARTSLSIKIEGNSEKNRNFIEGFASWFESFLIKGKDSKDSVTLLKI